MNLNADYSKEVFEVLECISIWKLFKAYISNWWVDQEINTNVPKSIEREISTLNKIYVNSLISMEDLWEYIIRKYIRNESERITAISNSDRESAEALLKILELKLWIDQKVDLIEKITDFLATKEVAHWAIPTKALIFHFSQWYILWLTNNESAGNEIENDKQIINKKLHDIWLLILQHSTKWLELAEVEKITWRKLKRLNEQYN
jgi:hypothetical protein